MNLLLTFLGLRALLASKFGLIVLMVPGLAWLALGLMASAPRLTTLNIFFVGLSLLLTLRFVRKFNKR